MLDSTKREIQLAKKRARRAAHKTMRLHTHEFDEITGLVEFPMPDYPTAPSGAHDPRNHAGWLMLPKDGHGRVTFRELCAYFEQKFMPLHLLVYAARPTG